MGIDNLFAIWVEVDEHPQDEFSSRCRISLGPFGKYKTKNKLTAQSRPLRDNLAYFLFILRNVLAAFLLSISFYIT
jgi:hypothetical protein